MSLSALVAMLRLHYPGEVRQALRQRNRRLLRWTVRWILTILLYINFWDYAPWVPWTLVVLAPLGVINLVFTFFVYLAQLGALKRQLEDEERERQYNARLPAAGPRALMGSGRLRV